jgi:DNA-binding transcriptional ArsR family regulator
MLAELAEPQSATTLATRLGLTRQKVNYHLRQLEQHGLVRAVDERRWGGLTERFLVATAAGYVVSPGALGEAAVDPERTSDRLSARYLIALAARIVREVADLVRRAEAAQQRLPTLSIDTTVHFRTAQERDAFTAELAETVTQLVARHSDDTTPDARGYRLVVAAHPIPRPEPTPQNPTPDDQEQS